MAEASTTTSSDFEGITVKSIKTLISQKDEIEKEIKKLTEFLDQGGYGLHKSLVDKDGFPISDVDKILSVRETRGKIARLQTDHKNLMKEIEKGILAVHAQERANNPPSDTDTVSSHGAKHRAIIDMDNIDKDTRRPFAKVDEVSANSPASLAGLYVNDLILSFGSIKYPAAAFKLVADLVRASENRTIQVDVKRQSQPSDGDAWNVISLNLVPKIWSGKGLLGCHLLPYSQ